MRPHQSCPKEESKRLAPPQEMNTLTIFHDPDCGLCTNFKRWLLDQDSYLPLEFIPYCSNEARVRLPLIERLNPSGEIVVMADDGRWWQGASAWLTCLWALKNYREWSFRLATPSLMPMVATLCHLLSENRVHVSRLLKLKGESLHQVVTELPSGTGSPSCDTERCRKMPKR